MECDMGKPTKVEHALRVAKVFELLAAGLTRAQIIRYVADKTEWGACERTVDSYIALATKEFDVLADVDRRVIAGMALARLNELYARSLRIQDFKTALAVQRELNKLTGLDVRWPGKTAG